jgi:hypothetical protein
MKIQVSAIVVSILIFAATLHAQKKYVIPSQPADVMVYEIRDGNNQVWEQTQTYGTCPVYWWADNMDMYQSDRTGDNDTSMLYLIGEGFERYCGEAIFCRMQPTGIVEHLRASASKNMYLDKCEYYPSSPPAGDTLTLRTWLMEHRDDRGIDSTLTRSFVRTLRQFDSTIFGKTTECFTVDIQRLDSRDTFTIANGFGLVRAIVHENGGQSYDARLQRAVLSGVRYNWSAKIINMMPICAGDVRQYASETEGWGQSGPAIYRFKYQTTADKDTLINGNTYYYLPTNASRQFLKYDWQRHTDNGTVAYRPPFGDVLIFPSYIVPDMVVDDILFRDTCTIDLYGKQVLTGKRDISYWPFRRDACFGALDGAGYLDTWAEGMGIIYSEYYDDWGTGNFYFDTLRYASICGVETGTLLDAGNTRPSATGAGVLLQNYPNPVSRNDNFTVIPFHLDGSKQEHVLITVSDLLGRKVAVLVDGIMEPGTHTAQLHTAALHSGIYYYTLRAGGRTETRKLLVSE